MIIADSRQQTADSRQQTRIVYLDAVKGLAIFLVVFGHCIQYFNGEGFDFFGDAVFKIIYSFHMPLFALVSGYLFYPSTRRMTPGSLIIKRSASLIMPSLSWALLVSAAGLIVKFMRGEIPGLMQMLIQTARNFAHGLWFLWAMFWSSLAVITARKFFQDRIIFYVLLLAPLMFLPKGDAYVFMYPYFVAGYIWHREGLDIKIHTLPLWLKVSASVAIIAAWLIMLRFFGHDSYVYTTGVSLVHYREKIFVPSQIWTDIFRWAIGFAGSLSVMIVMKLVKPVKILALIGTKTMGIYILSNYVFAHIRLGHGGYIINFIEALIIVSLCYALTVLIGKNITLRKIFLGGR